MTDPQTPEGPSDTYPPEEPSDTHAPEEPPAIEEIATQVLLIMLQLHFTHEPPQQQQGG